MLRTKVGASMLDAGREAEARGDYPSAQAYYRSAYERDSKGSEAAISLSRVLRRLSRPREALAIAERALQSHKDDPRLLTELGKSQLAANDTLEAIESLSRAGTALPDDWEIQSALGVGFDRIGMYEQAATRYEKALLLSPGNAVVLNNYALSLAQIGELERAIELLEKATALPERTSQMRQNLALLYATSGRIEDAERLVRQDLVPEVATENLAYYRHLARRSNRGIPQLPAPTPAPGSDIRTPSSSTSTVAEPPVPPAPVTPVARAELPGSQVQAAASQPASVQPAPAAAPASVERQMAVTSTAEAETTPPADVAAMASAKAETVASSGGQERSKLTAEKAVNEPLVSATSSTEGLKPSTATSETPPASVASADVPGNATASAADRTPASFAPAMDKPAADTDTRAETQSTLRHKAVYDDNVVAARLQAEAQAEAKPAPPAPSELPPKVAVPTAERTPAPRETPVILPVAATSAPSPASNAAGPIYRVQLGSYRNEADASHGLSRLRSAHEDILASLKLDIVPVTLPERGDYFRILTAPFASRTAADGVCQELQSREVSCFVRRD